MIRNLPKKMTELGRIRIGDREPNSSGRGTHPHKLGVFRLTAPNPSLLHFAASTYGGDVRPWVGEGAPKDDHERPTQFELYTTANAMDVLIPTFSAVSVDFEQWSAGGCQRRCTGEEITHCPLQEALIGTACTCPADEQERGEMAKTGKACARILRLNVILPDLPGMGTWRLETKGYYATAELLGTLDMLQMAGQEHQIIEATLRLEERTVKRPGRGEGKGTLKFVVPVLWPKYTPRQIMASAAERGLLLMAPPAPAVPALLEGKPLETHIADLYGEPADYAAANPASAEVAAKTAVKSESNPEPEPPAAANGKQGGELYLQQILAVHRAHGKSALWVEEYETKVRKQNRPVSALKRLLDDVRQSYRDEIPAAPEEAPAVIDTTTGEILEAPVAASTDDEVF